MSVRHRSKQSAEAKKSTNVRVSESNSKDAEPATEIVQPWLVRLFEPEDCAWIVAFRVVWGLLMAYEGFCFVDHGYAKLEAYYLAPLFTAKYYGFEWVDRLPLPYMYAAPWVMIVTGFMMATGCLYRLASIIFFIVFNYLYLIDMSLYLNHFYLLSCIQFLVICLPANRAYSVDAHYFWPKMASQTVPKWCRLLFQVYIAIVYEFAAVCKVNADWLRAEPLRHWLPKRHSFPLLGHLMTLESTSYLMSYTGLIYDAIIGPMFFIESLKPLAWTLSLFFHGMNKVIFNIGIFPWMMIGLQTVYLTPDWPRTVFAALSNSKPKPGQRVRKQPSPRNAKKIYVKAPLAGFYKLSTWQKVTVILLGIFLVYQVLMPFRHHLYPGDVAWNEYGHRFSWRMKLRDKNCDGNMFLVDKKTQLRSRNISPVDFLTPKQWRKVKSRPDHLIQLAKWMQARVNAHVVDKNSGDVQVPETMPEVHMNITCQLNFRPPQLYIKPEYDLTAYPNWEWPYPFVTELEPLTEELLADYPWNFKWTFSWLTTFPQVDERLAFDASSDPYYQTMVRHQQMQAMEERARHDPIFAEKLRQAREQQALKEKQEHERWQAAKAAKAVE